MSRREVLQSWLAPYRRRRTAQGLSLTGDFRDKLGAWIKKNKSADAAPSS